MGAINNQADSVSSVMGENQRRFLLEVLRANLRAKSAAAAGASCEQQSSTNEIAPHHPASLRVHHGGVASALTGTSGIYSSQKLGMSMKGGERNVNSAVVAKDSIAWQLHASVAAGPPASDPDGLHPPRTCIADGGGLEKAAVDNGGILTARQGTRVERDAGEGGRQQGLSLALFAKLAESLPKDQGKLHFLMWGDGTCYCGTVAGGSLDGVGVYKYADNSIYCGQWARDHLQGHGAFITSNGFLYRGTFEADKQHGAGVFVVPNGKTFFGTFVHGRLHGLSCCVSVSGGARPLLGEWRDGEFQRVFPLHARVADFYLRIAESVDLLESVWKPLPIPVPDATTLGTMNEEVTVQVSCRSDQQVCNAAVLEALRMELPTNLLQVTAAFATDEEALLASQAERHINARLACNGKPIVKKRKASSLRPQGRDTREVVVASKSRCLAQESGGSSGGTPTPQRATTTKAQLLRWESEARKLPRIPHLNYNRVLGRWYARVRDPASGRRIWKGYTCAVHGFYQARDMAIDRLRQFSQLVSPLASGEPDNATVAEDLQTSLTSDTMAVRSQNQHDETDSCGGPTETVIPLAARSPTGAALSEGRGILADMPPLANEASDRPSCCLDTTGTHADADLAMAVPTEGSGCEKSAVEDEAHLRLQAAKAENLLGRASCTEASELATQMEPAPSAGEDHIKQQLSMDPSAHCFGPEPSGDVCCRLDTVVAQEGESIACSRLTTADCSESALSRCTPLPM